MNDLYGLTRVFCVLMTAMLLGCSEGGTGGTGGISPPDVTSGPGGGDVSISGYGHKGPYEAGASVTVVQLEGAVPRGSTAIISDLGDYELTVEADGVLQIDVSGRYFSETVGAYTGAEIALSAIVDPISQDTRVNVNLLTHLIHSRVLELIDADSIEAGSAIEMAQSEFLLAFSNLLPPPDGVTVFSNLLIVNAIQEGDDEVGNAYLLALSSLLERHATNLAAENGTAQDVELGSFINQLADDLSNDGALDLSAEVEADLQLAMAELNPSAIYVNLLGIDQLLELAIQASDVVQADASVFSETVNVVDDSFEFSVNAESDDPLTATTSVAEIVADMDLFIDTDGDGVVNGDDTDDDGDGVADVDDDTPYGDGQ
jgi:hypothetical protein